MRILSNMCYITLSRQIPSNKAAVRFLGKLSQTPEEMPVTLI